VILLKHLKEAQKLNASSKTYFKIKSKFVKFQKPASKLHRVTQSCTMENGNILEILLNRKFPNIIAIII